MSAALIAALELAAQLEPLIAGLIPLIQKEFSGVQFTDADLDALGVTKAALDAKVAAQAGTA
jgi:hypothetical protein